MPIRQRTTALLAFGFESPSCVKCCGSSDKHSTMLVRIRKHDLADIERHATQGASQIYVRVPDGEALAIDIDGLIKIDTKKCEQLSFTVSAIHVLTCITSRTRFHRTAVLSGRFV